MTSMSSDWGELDGDLLDMILSNLFCKDRLSFSLVSKHWNTVAANSQYRYSPCLMYYYWRTRTWRFYQYNSFFNISFPELEDSELRCSRYGWMLMSRYDDTLFFFDPSNNRKVELPCKVNKRYYPLSFFNPPTSRECVVVGIRSDLQKVEICTLKLGEDEWEILEFPINEPQQDYRVSLGAPVLHCGLIYLLTESGDVATFDIKQRRLDFNFNCIRPENDDIYDAIKEQYLVKVNGEDALYCVFVFDDDRKVNVHRLSSDMKWDLVEEEGIGDKVFYVSHMCSFGDKARYKNMENTIRFPVFCGDAAVFYSLSDAKYHSLDGDYLENNAYGLKRMDRVAWLMPMLVQEVTTTLSWL